MLFSMDTTPLIAPLAISVAAHIMAICFLVLASKAYKRVNETSIKIAFAFLAFFLMLLVTTSTFFMGFLGYLVIIFS